MVAIPNPTREHDQDQAPVGVLVDEVLVEQIWREVQGKASRRQIHQLVMEATSEFAQARITTYVPIFIRRQVHEKLVLMRNTEETARTALELADNPGVQEYLAVRAVERVGLQARLPARLTSGGCSS